MRQISSLASLAAILSMVACHEPGAKAHPTDPGVSKTPVASKFRLKTGRGERLIYVPAYTYATSGNGQRIKLATTLTVHNISSQRSISLRSVEYDDALGKKVKSYLPEPQQLSPFETVEFLINEPEQSDGSGANFIVRFDITGGAPPPLVEAVMVGNTGSGWLSFTSRGVLVGPR